MEQNQNTSLFGLSIDPTSKANLAEAARWARFISIIGFIFLGLFVIIAIFAGTYLTTVFSGGGMYDDYGGGYNAGMAVGVILYYLIIGLIVFFGYLFLYRFSSLMKRALDSNDQETLNRSFQNLKILFRYWGILTIIGLAFFVIAILIGIVGAASAGL